MTHRIPISFIPWPGALSVQEAAVYLGSSRQTVYNLTQLPKSNPRRIRKTSYGKIPVSELDRHLAEEVARA